MNILDHYDEIDNTIKQTEENLSHYRNDSFHRLKALIVVDMQNDFVTGSLANDAAQQIVSPIAQRIEQARNNNEFVVWTLDTHTDDYLRTQEGKYLPVPHCIRDTTGHELIPELQALYRDSDVVVEKNAFGSTELPIILLNSAKELGVKQKDIEITFVGICTDICLVSNVLMCKAWLPEAHIVVDAKLCAGTTPEAHDAALTTMKSCQVDII